MIYRDTIEMEDHFTLGMVNAVEEFLRGLGQVERAGRRMTFELDIEGDLWDARERIAEVEIELHSRGIDYTADRSKLQEVAA